MVDSCIKRKGKLIPSIHRQRFRPVAHQPAHVASQVLRRKVRHRAILQPCRVGVGADVLPGRELCSAVGELLEDVVTGHKAVGRYGCDREDGDPELHDFSFSSEIGTGGIPRGPGDSADLGVAKWPGDSQTG